MRRRIRRIAEVLVERQQIGFVKIDRAGVLLDVVGIVNSARQPLKLAFFYGFQLAHTKLSGLSDGIEADALSKTMEDLETYAKRLGDLPLLYNGDLLPLDELAKYPFKVTIHIGTMLAAYQTMRDTMRELKRTGKLSANTGSHIFGEFIRTMRVPEYQALEEKYKK